MSQPTAKPTSASTLSGPNSAEGGAYAAFAFRLSGREWGIVLWLVLAVVLLTPVLGKRWDRYDASRDYRIPYALSKDYWLYDRRVSEVAVDKPIYVLGDSVVWGEYVSREGTLSYFLNELTRSQRPFVNAGVNGLFPLALEGLVRDYGQAMRDSKVILHCNLLWLSSPKADLSIEKEEKFNHPRLVPQWHPVIPCYRASIDERLGISLERRVPILQWVNHLQNAYFDQKSLYQWTLADDGNYPPRYPNVWGNPLRRIRREMPAEPLNDPSRGVASARHKPWSTTGVGTQNFEWVRLEDSLQWHAFLKLVSLLEKRGNNLLIVVGPFNEHIMTRENAAVFRRLKDEAVTALKPGRRVVVPELLPSELYGDASHPLTEGYRQLARNLVDNPETQRWLKAD